MSIFSILVVKLIPLYISILLGYLAGKWLDASRDTIAKIIFFIIAPIVIFSGIVNTHIDLSILSLPLFTFAIASIISIAFYKMGKIFWSDSTRNILAFTAGNGNTGFFGLSVALALFSKQAEGIYIMCLLGITLFENTLGFYLTAKVQNSAEECLKKVLRLPSIYAFLAALFVNQSGFQMPDMMVHFIDDIRGTYTILGMMIIGLGLASLKSFKLDFKFISLAFLAKFLVWPIIILSLLYLDDTYFGFYDNAMHQALILISIVPLAVNTVVIATILNIHPDKAASAVLISTLFALFYVPFMTALYIH